MRPHVEVIQDTDYIWHKAELYGGEGEARERRLSVDEEDGSSSLTIEFLTDWGRPGGVHHADTEWYVLNGEMNYGGKTFTAGGYVQVPKGVVADYIKFTAGTTVLHFREFGDAGYDIGAERWSTCRPDEQVTTEQTTDRDFDPVPTAGPMPGLVIKYLHVDATTGFYSRLVRANEGWADHRLAHHPCYEEAYQTSGLMTYNFGTITEGSYFFRPARVKHGHFVSMDGGAVWLLRSDGELTNWYTQNEWVRWGGDAVNYGKAEHWTKSTFDLATRPTWRTEHDLTILNNSVEFQLSQGAKAVPYLPWGFGEDHSAAGFDLSKYTSADNVLTAGPTQELQIYPDAPEPIISSLPVRSKSHGDWDGDGM